VPNKGATGTIFYNVLGIMQSLTWILIRYLPHSKPALLPLGYRRGRCLCVDNEKFYPSLTIDSNMFVHNFAPV